jgi:hypothetical protein
MRPLPATFELLGKREKVRRYGNISPLSEFAGVDKCMKLLIYFEYKVKGEGFREVLAGTRAVLVEGQR